MKAPARDAITNEPVPQPESLTEWVLTILPSPQVVAATWRASLGLILSGVLFGISYWQTGVDPLYIAMSLIVGFTGVRIGGEGFADAYRNITGHVVASDVTQNK